MSELNTALWSLIGSSPASLTFYASVGAVLTLMLLTVIWSYAFTYYEHFGKSDSPKVVGAVTLGLVLSTALAILQVVQLHKITRNAHHDYASVIRFDVFALAAQQFVGQWTANVGCAYYAYRVYQLLNRPWHVVVVVGSIGLASGAWTFPMIIQTAQMPPLTLENFPRLVSWWTKTRDYHIVSLALAFATCTLTGAFMLRVLLLSRKTLFSVERRIYKRLITLMLETMIPSCIIALSLEASWSLRPIPMVDWRRSLLPLCAPLHMLFIMHTLVSRLTVRRILSAELASNGIDHSGATGGSQVPLTNVYTSLRDKGSAYSEGSVKEEL